MRIFRSKYHPSNGATSSDTDNSDIESNITIDKIKNTDIERADNLQTKWNKVKNLMKVKHKDSDVLKSLIQGSKKCSIHIS